MRLMLGFVALLVVLMAVLFSAKKQAQALQPPTPSASTAGAVDATSLPPQSPQAVGRQVQDALQQGAQRASEASP